MSAVPPELMPAAVYVGDGKIEVEHVPAPEPGPGELLVEIAECGICGSDLHMVLENYAKPGSILGHEWSGVVVSAEGDSGWAPGQRVVGNPTPGCGACRPCRRGRPSVCLRRRPADFLGSSGAFCRYKTVPVGGALAIPDSLSSRGRGTDRADGHCAARRAHGPGGASRSRPGHGRRPRRSPHRRRAARPGGDRRHRQRTLADPARAGHGRRSRPGGEPRDPGGPAHGLPRVRALCGRVRVLGTCKCRRASAEPPGLRRHLGHRRYRIRAPAGEPEPHDHLRARGCRRLQLQRRRLRPGGGVARQRSAPDRVPPRTR